MSGSISGLFTFLFLCFSLNTILFLQLVELFVRPSVCREIPKYSTDTPKVTGSKISDILSISGRNLQEVWRRGVSRNLSFPLLIMVKLMNICAIFFLNSVLWLLLYLCFRLNVMGLLFVLVKMSVVLNIYAFLGQRSKAVSFLRNIIFLWTVLFCFLSASFSC